jgi:hypothetical protein
MNSLTKKLLSAAEMSSRLPRILAFGLLGLFCASVGRYRSRVGNVYFDCRQGRCRGGMVSIDRIHRSAPIRGAFPRTQLQARASRNDSNGDSGSVLLLSPRCNRVGQRVIL